MSGIFDKSVPLIQTDTAPSRIKALPRFFLANACSLPNKVDELQYVLQHNNVDIAVITESWLKAEQEETCQLPEYKSYNKNRQEKDGGGVSVLIKNDIPSSVIQVDTSNLEIIWISTRPVWLPRTISTIIIAAVYFPPKATADTRDRLTKHIVTTAQMLQSKYTNPAFAIMGDLNQYPVTEVTKALNLKQVVKIPTRGKNTLDKILTNMHKLYMAPTSLPPLGNSDHISVLWEPCTQQLEKEPSIPQYTRRFPDSGIREFGRWITQQSWQEVLEAKGTDNKCDIFYDMIWKKIDDIFPLKKRRTHPRDKPWMTNKIKALIAERQKAHKLGNDEHRKQLARIITQEIKQAKKEYHTTQIERINKAEPRNWFNHMKRILGTEKKDSLNNIEEISRNPDRCADTINKHFAAINTTLPPSTKNNFQHTYPHGQPLSL